MAKKVEFNPMTSSSKSVKSAVSKKTEKSKSDKTSIQKAKPFESEEELQAEEFIPLQSEIKPEPKTNWLLLVLVSLFLLVIGIQQYFSMSQNDRDQLNRLLATVGLLPWSESAKSSVRLVTENSKKQIASSIIAVTHPSGVEPKLDSYDVSSNGNVITVLYNCSFKGGFIGNYYKLELKWRFSKTQNFGVAVVKDDTMLGVMPQMMDQLNKYFQTEVYPTVLENAK